MPERPMPVFEERLGMPREAWGLFLLALAVTFLLVHPLAIPFTAAAWTVSVFRYAGTVVWIDEHQIVVGRRAAPLHALDLSTLGRAHNPWPWRVFSPRYLGANPIWTRDSVGVLGSLGPDESYRVAVGTNRREELVAALTALVPAAKQRHAASLATSGAGWAPPAQRLPPPGWYPDPWAPVQALRWWDGAAWTSHVAVRRVAR